MALLLPRTTAGLPSARVVNPRTRQADSWFLIQQGDEILDAVAYLDRVVVKLVQSGGSIREFDISREEAESIGVVPKARVELGMVSR